MNDKTEEIAEVFMDFLNALEAAVVNAKKQIGAIAGVVESAGLTWNPNNIHWEKAEGSSGIYERSEDVNNADFKAMLKDLQDHKGKLSHEKLFYWVFQNGYTVGRKERKF